MELEERKSGLVVPKKPPESPTRRYGLLEIQDDGERGIAKEALSLLWDAMDLSSGGGLRLPNDGRRDEHYRLYRFMGEALLGEECPEKEVLT